MVAELEHYPEGGDRARYALTALRIGTLCLRQASGELGDPDEVRHAAAGGCVQHRYGALHVTLCWDEVEDVALSRWRGLPVAEMGENDQAWSL